MLTIQKFPEHMGDLPIDMKHPNRALIAGVFAESVKVNGTERPFLTYIPENQEYCRPCLVTGIPSGNDPLAYLESSGLKEFVDQNELFLHIAYTDGKWDSSDAEYLNAIYVKIQARDYYITMQDNIYLCGIGDAAFAAHQAARRMASEWSGMMSFGDLAGDLTAEKARAHGEEDQGEVELKIQGTAAQLPVWMTVSAYEGNNRKASEYWQEQNRTCGEPLSGRGADYIWMPDPVRKVNEINDIKIDNLAISGLNSNVLNLKNLRHSRR